MACALAGVDRFAHAAGEPVWVLLSDETATYAEAASVLQSEWRGGRGRDLQILSTRELPTGAPPAALITLGSVAMRVAMERAESSPEWARVPILSALVTKEGFNSVWKHPPAWVSAACLDQPVERYVELIRRALPRLSRVGVLLGSETLAMRAALAKAASDRGVQVVVGVVTRPEAMYASLRTVLAESDVLLVLPDRSVADAAGLQNILISAYRQRVPVVTYSPALVKAGATLGLYASPAQVGRQVAAMLKGPMTPQGWPALRVAEGCTVAINEQVARSLGLDIPERSELADALQRQEGLK